MHPRVLVSAALLAVLVVAGSSAGCAQPVSGPTTGTADAPRDAALMLTHPRWSVPGPVDSVLAISIDGLNPAALRRLGPRGTPHLHEFMDDGASTLNARTEYEQTVTLPNHTGMVTGRRITARRGGHGVTWNDDRRRPATVQAAAGHDVASVFSSIATAGGSSALFASKTKFALWQRSWPDGIARTEIDERNARLVRTLQDDIATTPRAFRFLHLSLPDVVGHDRGFMSPAYLKAVRRVDRLVGLAVGTIDADPALAEHTAIIVTSDHGGRGATHSDRGNIDNYRIAFMVRGPGVDAGADLYALNPDYRNPRGGRPAYGARTQPVRNGDLANLALDLLGQPPVPESEHDLAQDLDVTAEP